MGKKSRAKRARREQAGFVAALTTSEGTFLERAPDAAEQQRINAAYQELKKHRSLAESLSSDPDAANRFSIELFRSPLFAPLQFEDWVVESLLDKHGEPPVVEDESDPAFSDWLRTATLDIASSRVRRAMAEQVRRFLPLYTEAGQIKEALAIEYNAYLTVMSEAVTPLLAQMLVGALARWYDEHEEDEEAEVESTSNAG
ncbi:MAG TPA: hypothetical protein VFX76_21935 [Roseiflexaceae bacterium]|nr:hypothetical protein [Roseiflexaceae bacterium]